MATQAQLDLVRALCIFPNPSISARLNVFCRSSNVCKGSTTWRRSDSARPFRRSAISWSTHSAVASAIAAWRRTAASSGSSQPFSWPTRMCSNSFLSLSLTLKSIDSVGQIALGYHTVFDEAHILGKGYEALRARLSEGEFARGRVLRGRVACSHRLDRREVRCGVGRGTTAQANCKGSQCRINPEHESPCAGRRHADAKLSQGLEHNNG